MARPFQLVQTREMPVFYGEELSIVTAKPVAVAKTKAVPMSQPVVAAPLPFVPPQITFSILPAYPETALSEGLSGKVLLSVLIGQNGQAKDVKVKSSSGVVEFDQSAVVAISRWKFSPASQAGVNVASWFEVPIRFEVK
ncbi:hypothetical protein A2548_01430 [candidate division WOR-1 bacterium RIFOXYD2_FULL_41_8]|nr:MAG: hypothetical protein A2548_01430 [candidate division WOR-1 bacterium RIFOXYD2_FULL_41_8]